ncbi:hypothetical protein ACT6QH_12970 [Xanthobacter sp. TB0139]|uniref:hypothetical protein n=1 Tax=Xanthobacter sp. TB0139 TaxID=3459178 RepID=UPI00403950A0
MAWEGRVMQCKRSLKFECIQGMCRSLLVVAAGLAGFWGGPNLEARAQSMPSTLNMSCAEAVKLVAKEGGVVLRTGENTFDRYVSGLRFCSMGDSLRPEWVPTRDKKECFIGYTCYVPSLDNKWD